MMDLCQVASYWGANIIINTKRTIRPLNSVNQYFIGLLHSFYLFLYLVNFFIHDGIVLLIGDIIEYTHYFFESVVDKYRLHMTGLAILNDGVLLDIRLKTAMLKIHVAVLFGYLRHDILGGDQAQFRARLLPHHRVGKFKHRHVEQQGVVDAIVLDKGGVYAFGSSIAGVVLADSVGWEKPIPPLPESEGGQFDEQADAYQKPKTSYVPWDEH